MAKTLALLLLLLQLISFTALAEEPKTDFDKPNRFRLPIFSPRVPVETDPIIFNPVINDPIITDPVVNPLDPNAPPAIETDRFRLPIFKPPSPIRHAPIKPAPVKPPVTIKPGTVRFDPVNPLDLSTLPPPVGVQYLNYHF